VFAARTFYALAASVAALAALVAPDALSAPAKGFAGFADAAADAGAPRDAAADAFRTDRTAPDPTPLVTKERWLFDLRYRGAVPRLVSVTRADLPAPAATARVFGRFAIELFEGSTLVERVRFDFPMITEPHEGRGIDLERKLSTRIGVYFPRTQRGTRLELWDRATDRRWSLPWPPEAAPQPTQ
jgi:hypothetical protein